MSERIRIKIDGKDVLVLPGTVLSELLDIEKPCGGRGSCGKCRVRINGEDALACRTVVTAEMEVETYARSEIYSETGVVEGGILGGRLALALDIGTTTLAMALVSTAECQALRVVTATNPQRTYGADVMTRIEYCCRHTVDALHSVLIDEINRMIDELGACVDTMYVSANVTMLHTLFGIDCSGMGVAPYQPAFLESKRASAHSLGIRGVETVITLPSVAPFVGADIVAGLHLLDEPGEGKYNLLVDLGTNAEIVLYSNRSGVATSAAAGPCFEGANISCGMSATRGAICAFSLNYGHAFCQTVEGAPPVGICGTGLIDAVSSLLKNCLIDETGYLDEPYFLADGVSISCEDVRQYLLAKSAVCAAILTLMDREGVGFEDVSAMYISGGFSAKINIPNAVATGLLPPALARKAVVLNNSSLQGTIHYACHGGDLTSLVQRIRYVDLASDPHFADFFMKNMSFDV